MKVTEGTRWRAGLPGVTWKAGIEVSQIVKETADELQFLVSPQHVAHRAHTVNSGVITVTVTSPLDDVIKVRIDHHSGRKDPGPNFELFPDGAPDAPKTSVSRPTKQSIRFTSGKLSVNVNTAPNEYGMEFVDATSEPKVLTSVGPQDTSFADVPYRFTLGQESEQSRLTTENDTLPRENGNFMLEGRSEALVRYMLNDFSLVVGETIYGLGERFGTFVKNGQVVGMFNDDHACHSHKTYKNIPFYLSSRGFGVFLNHPEEVEYEIGRAYNSKIGISVRGERLEYFIIGGGSTKAALQKYVQMVGRPALPPAWTFGLYLTTSFTTSYDEATVSHFLQKMKDNDCPVRVFHLDCFWMEAYDWCSFRWDPIAFPNPRKYLADIKAKFGVKICAWVNPYISQRTHLFQEGMDKGYFVTRKDGSVWQWDWWQPGMAVVDFSNPDAYKWYAGLIRELLDTGVDTIKTDFGERSPHKDVTFHDGSDPRKMHNYYSYLYNKCVWDVIEDKYGKHEAALWARSATTGSQRLPIHWGGDPYSTWEGMAETLRGGLSLGLSGFSFWSHDIGGFRGSPDPVLFCRWAAFGLFSSHSRLHGCDSYRVPWDFGDEAVRITSKMTHEKMRLMPYIFGSALQAHETGLPLMRAMVLEFPDDLVAPTLDKQFMLGDSLLVAPVFGNTAQFYIPEGRWTNYWTGETVDGPRWVVEKDYPLDEIPLYVRPGTVLLLGPEKIGVPDYDYASVGLEVRAYEVEQEVTVRVPAATGAKWAGSVSVAPGGTVSATGVKVAPRQTNGH
ncbi:hypothetical protein Q8F55_005892 [Vanrija albida]|uniref:Glycoside hydrolase family 31 N-terminal domain-containing protein n=1 Tax=Vanrija albida TaxID=181172 RepID=A0ABR3Q3X3_9TREE